MTNQPPPPNDELTPQQSPYQPPQQGYYYPPQQGGYPPQQAPYQQGQQPYGHHPHQQQYGYNQPIPAGYPMGVNLNIGKRSPLAFTGLILSSSSAFVGFIVFLFFGLQYGNGADSPLYALSSFIPFFLFIWFVLAIMGIIFSQMGLNQVKRQGFDGKKFAIAGLIIGYVQVAVELLSVAALVFFILFVVATISGSF